MGGLDKNCPDCGQKLVQRKDYDEQAMGCNRCLKIWFPWDFE